VLCHGAEFMFFCESLCGIVASVALACVCVVFFRHLAGFFFLALMRRAFSQHPRALPFGFVRACFLISFFLPVSTT